MDILKELAIIWLWIAIILAIGGFVAGTIIGASFLFGPIGFWTASGLWCFLWMNCIILAVLNA